MRAKSILQIATVSALLALAVPLLAFDHSTYPTAHAANKTIYLVATGSPGYFYWNSSNPTITVNQGDTVTMDLSSTTGTYSHTFWLDLDGDGASDQSDCGLTLDPCISTPFTTPQTLTFTVNTVETVTYFCTIHSPAMTGSFKVQAPPTPNFSISSSPTSLSFQQGSSLTSTVTLTSQNGFSGTVSLSATSSPTGQLTTSLKPSSVTLSSGTTQTSTLSVNSTGSTLSGSYTVTVTGTSGSIINPATVSVTINPPASQNFALALSSTSLNVAQGSTGTTTITLTSQNGFSGTVSLVGTVSPSGPTVSFSPTSVSVSNGYPGSSTMTVNAMGGYYSSVANGNYVVNITATSGSLSHSTTEQVIVGSNSSPSSPLSFTPTLIGAIAVIVIAAVAITVLLIRRKPRT